MKKTNLLLLLSLSLGALSACGVAPQQSNSQENSDNSEASEVSESSEAQNDPEKTISIWTTFNDSYKAVFDKAIRAYEAQYPGYKVSYEKVSGSYNDLASNVEKGFAAGNYPDMIACYPDSVANFIMAGRSVNMQPYMEAEGSGWSQDDIDDIPEAYLEEGSSYFIPGTYSLPMAKSTEAMYYNKKIIGVDLSTYDEDVNDGNPITEAYLNNLTWEECFDHLCPALIAYNNAQPESNKLIKTDGTYKDNWAVMGYDSDDNLFITLAEQYGYGYTSVNQATGNGSIDFVNPEMKALMKKFNDAYTKHYFTTTGVAGTRCNNISTAGSMLLSIGSTGGVKYQYSDTTRYDVGVVRIPHAAGKQYRVINQGPSMTVLKHPTYATQHAQQAWNFYKILTNEELALEWALQTGYAPIRYSTSETDAYLNYCNENKYDLNTLERLTARNQKYVTTVLSNLFSSPVFYGSSKARTAVGGLTTDCIGNKGNGAITDAQIDTFFTNAYNNAI